MVKERLILLTLAPFFLVAAFEPIGIWFTAPIAFAIYLTFLRGQRFTLLYSVYFAFTANSFILFWSGAYVGVLPWIALSVLQTAYFLPDDSIF